MPAVRQHLDPAPQPSRRSRPAIGSATVPTAGQSAVDVLLRRKETWNRRPLTREVYRRYFEMIRRELAPGGRTLEVGGGTGNAGEFLSDVWITDIVATPFVHVVADASNLPLPAGSLDNVFMVDVLHHLPHPQRLFRESARVLRRGGRLILLEPYISAVSRLVLRWAHPEPVNMNVDPLPPGDEPVFDGAGPFCSNQAIPTLLFARRLPQFRRMFPMFEIRVHRLDSVFVYPLSGGFSSPCLLPRFTHGAAWAVERLLQPMRRWLAFRLLVVLERL